MFDHAPYRLGLGTYSLTGDAGTEAMVAALEAGYRHVDTARLYGNEAAVGDALDAASVDRDEVFVATKVGHFEEPEKTPEYVRTSVDESRERLGVDTIDLLYHHWPRRPEEIDTVLPVLAELREAGVVDRIGVSNYRSDDVDHAVDLVDAPLYANQVEMHPLLQQDDLYEHCRSQDMFVVAYSPIAQGKVFDVPEIVAVAEEHDTTPAVVSLAWVLSREGVVAIPRSSTVPHIEENLAGRDLNLPQDALDRIDAIDETHRCEDPDWMAW